MEEQRETVVDRIREHQMRVKELFDREARERSFQVGDLVLLWDKRREPKGLHGKFDSLWRGPFQIRQVCGTNSFYLAYLDGTHMPLPYNGQHLKLYNP